MAWVQLSMAVVAVVVSCFAAMFARRSANAAERSARAGESAAEAARRSATVAEGLIGLERGRAREEWIGRLGAVLPDVRELGPLLRDLPEWLKPDWRALVTSAAERNPKMPAPVREKYLSGMWAEWEGLMAERKSPLLDGGGE